MTREEATKVARALRQYEVTVEEVVAAILAAYERGRSDEREAREKKGGVNGES